MAEKHGTENSLCFQHLLIFMACFGTSLATGRLCKFAEKFPGVGGSCYKESTDVTSELGSSNEGTSLPVDATSYTTIRTNCLTSNGSVIQNGSLLVNEDCTRISTCDNGAMNYNDLYQCSSDAVCGVRNDVFQRRVNGSVDFNRTWISYKGGFGDVIHEFWLGNDKLYHLTNQGNYQLRVDFVSRDGDPFYAKFDRFRINNESDNYRLSRIGEYSGNAGGAGGLINRLNYSFSTSDKNNGGCSDDYHCGWWFRDCNLRSLNGDFHAALNVRLGISWYTPSGCYDNIKYTEMKIRPV
ncbi:ficolin-1-A-like [Apostichopus japonicus]|uniref:ficolin-1-A-like n=1 Tax=Stichopus japonicus TaxID=307972 RepID=UPI003AB53531